VDKERPFGEPLSSEEPRDLELRRAHEHGRGTTSSGVHTDEFRSPVVDCRRRLVFRPASNLSRHHRTGSAYGLFFNASTITNNLSLLNDVVPGNVLGIVHEQAGRIASNSGRALSIGIVVGILVSLSSAMSGVKAMIDALNVIYEQKECRSFLKLNLVALVFTLAGFAAFLLAMATIVVLPLILSPIGLGSLTETVTRIGRWPLLLVVLLIGLAVLYRYGPDRRKARWEWVTVGSVFAAVTWIVASFLFS
jgi:membrane protein